MCRLLQLTNFKEWHPCTPNTSDATNCHSRLSALERLVAQVVTIVAKNNAPIVIGKGMN
jgi:hypothetical protein